MKNIIYKYNVGDYVRFKDKFNSPSTGLVGKEGTIAKITGIAPSYNNKPHYYLDNNICGAYKESCFAGLATESEFRAQLALDAEVDTLQGPETKGDTGDSRESTWEFVTMDDIYCSNCERAALNDYRGNPSYSRFCPWCGKYMTNHQQPED